MKRILLALLLLATPAAARAQTTAAPPSTATAGQVAAARDLMVAMDMEANYRKMLDSNLMPRLSAMGHSAQADSTAAFVRRMMPWSEMEPRYVQLYADLFSEADLRQLAAFYRTPTGRRMVAVTPEMTTRIMQISEQQMQAHMPEFTAYVQRMVGTASPTTP